MDCYTADEKYNKSSQCPSTSLSTGLWAPTVACAHWSPQTSVVINNSCLPCTKGGGFFLLSVFRLPCCLSAAGVDEVLMEEGLDFDTGECLLADDTLCDCLCEEDCL